MGWEGQRKRSGGQNGVALEVDVDKRLVAPGKPRPQFRLSVRLLTKCKSLLKSTPALKVLEIQRNGNAAGGWPHRASGGPPAGGLARLASPAASARLNAR